MTADVLDLALDELVPRCDSRTGDWQDVLRRAGVHAMPQPAPQGATEADVTKRARVWRRHPRGAVALAFALLLVVVLATPAFGVQGYVLHLLGRKNVSFVNSPSAPNVVKKQFLDLPLGAPLQFSPQVEAAQARVVATFSIAGHPRKLWVAPTRQGGYCYTFELNFGGCRATRGERLVGRKGQLGVSWQGGPPRSAVNESIVTRVGGDLTAPSAAKITAHYADGSSVDIPFVWVSRPIAAGFFSYDIPVAHWNKQHRLVDLTLYAKDGRQLARQTFPYEAHPRPVRVPVPPRQVTLKPHVLPTAPPAPPSAPTEQGTADGFQVVVGHNGVVQFSEVAETPILRALAGRNVEFDCFRLTKEFGIFTVRSFGRSGALMPKVGFALPGVGRPVDGCEVEASIGRTWPDRLHNRAASQIALTAAAQKFFSDRAAARDLALFVRSRRLHQLRREPAAQARRDVLRVYGKELARSPIRITVPKPNTLVFSERSTSGKLFTVTVRGGHIVKKNLEPYAFVF